MSESKIENTIKRLLQSVPQPKLPDEDRNKFISWLYNVSDERKSVSDFVVLRNTRKAVLSGAAVIALVLCFNLLILPQATLVTNIKGTVKMCRAGTNVWFFVEKDKIAIRKNDILKTFSDGQVDIISARSYQVRLSNDSEIKMVCAGSRISKSPISYDLAKGKVYAYYNKDQRLKKEFNIWTQGAQISVLGTDFMVTSMPALNRTWIGVLDGVVKVTGLAEEGLARTKDNTVLVQPGEKTIVMLGKAPSRPARLMENELLELEELYRIGTKPQVALLISTGKTRVRELLSLTLLYISSESSGVFPEKIEKAEKNFRKIVKTGPKEKWLENISEFEDIVNKYPNPKYDVQFLLFIGAYYEYAGEHEKTIELFKRVIEDYPRSNLASIAECAIGILYEEKLNDLENAKAAYGKVISNYPRSAEVDEALSGLRRISAKNPAI